MDVLVMLKVVLDWITWLATLFSVTETILVQKAAVFPKAEEQGCAKRTDQVKTLSLTGLK